MGPGPAGPPPPWEPNGSAATDVSALGAPVLLHAAANGSAATDVSALRRDMVLQSFPL